MNKEEIKRKEKSSTQTSRYLCITRFSLHCTKIWLLILFNALTSFHDTVGSLFFSRFFSLFLRSPDPTIKFTLISSSDLTQFVVIATRLRKSFTYRLRVLGTTGTDIVLTFVNICVSRVLTRADSIYFR